MERHTNSGFRPGQTQDLTTSHWYLPNNNTRCPTCPLRSDLNHVPAPPSKPFQHSAAHKTREEKKLWPRSLRSPPNSPRHQATNCSQSLASSSQGNLPRPTENSSAPCGIFVTNLLRRPLIVSHVAPFSAVGGTWLWIASFFFFDVAKMLQNRLNERERLGTWTIFCLFPASPCHFFLLECDFFV